MNTKRMLILGLALLLGLLTAAGCGGGSKEADSQTPAPGYDTAGRGGGDPVTVTSRYQDLEFTLTLPKTRFAPGEAVPITATVRNTGMQEVHTTVIGPIFRGSAWNGDTPIWSYVVGGVGGSTRLILAPGQSETRSMVWNQRGNATNGLYSGEGDYVRPGQYTLRAVFAAYTINGVEVPREERSLPPVEITIAPSLPALGDYRDLRLTLSLPRTRFLVSEPVPMTLTVTNTGSAPINAVGIYPTPRLYISGASSYATPYPGNDAPTVTEVFQPGETKTYQGTWDQSLNLTPNPRPAEPGRYTVRASLGYHLINGADVEFDRLSAPTVEITLVSTPDQLTAPEPPPSSPGPPAPPPG